MAVYTKVPKPTNNTYTRVNAEGRLIYDDINVLYDDSNVFYDGVNYSAFTKVSKPVGTPYTNKAKPST